MKRRFEFRLGRVLRVRALEEQQARVTWGRADREARRAEEAVEDSRGALQALREDLSQARLDARVAAALVIERLLETRSSELANHLRRSHTLGQQAAQLRHAWQAAEAHKRALVELEDRGRQEHRRAVEAAEQRVLDEHAPPGPRDRTRNPEEGSSSGPPTPDERADLPVPSPPR